MNNWYNDIKANNWYDVKAIDWYDIQNNNKFVIKSKQLLTKWRIHNKNLQKTIKLQFITNHNNPKRSNNSLQESLNTIMKTSISNMLLVYSLLIITLKSIKLYIVSNKLPNNFKGKILTYLYSSHKDWCSMPALSLTFLKLSVFKSIKSK